MDSLLFTGNTEFLEDLYQRYLEDPQGVPANWRQYFDGLESVSSTATTSVAATSAITPPSRNEAVLAQKQIAVTQLIAAYRFRGHRLADIDPLKIYERALARDLDPAYHGLTETDLDHTYYTGMVEGIHKGTLREILANLRDTYCGSIGAEYMYISSSRQKVWIQDRLESCHARPDFSTDKKKDILRQLTAGVKLEEYLHRKYVGQKRFSLEGGESLIPMLDELIQISGEQGVREVIIGMAHRGRLNVLVNIFGKSPELLFGEFEGKVKADQNGSGDVKYHMGFSSNVETPGGATHIVLSFNPSHLEIINPVIEGSVRARQERRKDLRRNQVLPVQIHGDAAFAGQGVVTETLNLAETRGYSTGGTIHIVINNQIGFTSSDPLDSRSTLYCTDIAKLVQAPIFHVNGNDPEAVLFVTRLAADYRMRFNRDVVIDLVCFRRHGHNEADEPLVTQPLMYQRIREITTVRKLYADHLEEADVLSDGEADRYCDEYIAALDAEQVVSRPLMANPDPELLVNWAPYIGAQWTDAGDTTISAKRFAELGQKLTDYPEEFELHRVVNRLIRNRRDMAQGKRPMDWGFAENLAYAALLEEGYPIRLSGQDSGRGTFSHRHVVLYDQKTGRTHEPLQHLFPRQPEFQVINSLLSEEAVLGFEFGYSSSEPESLVIWEAQFGDFANNAQVVIDQFLSSSEAKWGRFCGLTMLLPHGFEGQGPEHSSARLERYLQLCAEDNIQVCMPSSPAQIFHLLRRQMIRPLRHPLIVMSPKSLLRHRLATSTQEELTKGSFQLVIDEVDPLKPAGITRLVLCAGKVYYDLLEARREHELNHIAIARVEQLYPFPTDKINALLARYPKAKEIIWAQEEPRNQGAWFHMLSSRHLAGCIDRKHTLRYVGRAYSASPATGTLSVHLAQQKALVDEALGLATVTSITKKRA